MRTGMTTKPASASAPFHAADHLRNDKDIAVYIEAMLEDSDPEPFPSHFALLRPAWAESPCWQTKPDSGGKPCFARCPRKEARAWTR
jgi:hypothetical protein